MKALCYSGIVLVACALSSCELTPSRGAAYGAGIGALVGALTEGSGHGALEGAMIGAAAGAVTGVIVKDTNEQNRYCDENPRGIPYATPTNRYHIVRSPHRPYVLVDVHGIDSDAIVIDPYTNKPFRNP